MRKIVHRNRSRFEIIAEILKKLHKPAGRTKIMSQCNMSFTQSEDYLGLMQSNSLVQVELAAGKVTYQRTEAGREFLVLFNSMIQLVDSTLSAASLT